MPKQLERKVQAALARRYGANLPEPILARVDTELRLITVFDLYREVAALSDLAEFLRSCGARYSMERFGPELYVLWLLGVTRTNPLPPHYFCPGCGKYEEMDVSDGFDLPEKTCSCGCEMLPDGHGISWDMFFGPPPYAEREQPEISVALPRDAACEDYLFNHPALRGMPMISCDGYARIGAIKLRCPSMWEERLFSPAQGSASSPAGIREYALAHWKEHAEEELHRFAPSSFHEVVRIFGMNRPFFPYGWPYTGENAWPLENLVAFADEIGELLTRQKPGQRDILAAMAKLTEGGAEEPEELSALPPELAWAVVCCKKRDRFPYRAQVIEELLRLCGAYREPT